MSETNDNIESLSEKSNIRSERLENLLFQLLKNTLSFENEKYFFISVDLKSDLFYAPISNLKNDLLKEIFDKTPTLIEHIRNSFPISIGQNKFISYLYQYFDQHRNGRDSLVIIHLDNDGGVKDIKQLYLGDNEIKDVSNEFEDSIKEKSLDPDVNALIEKIRCIEDLNDFEKCLILRLDQKIPDKTKSRSLELIQLGFLFLEGDFVNKLAKLSSTIFQAIQITSFATLTLFYEKERYFQKALRQAVKGTIIKYGDGRGIVSQVNLLNSLNRNEFYNIPAILKVDPDIKNKSEHDIKEYAWYEMPKYTMPSLLDLFCFTKGLKDYEVASLVRSSLNHLLDTYWQPDMEKVSVKTRSYIGVALSLAIFVTRKAGENILRHKKSIEEGLPIKFERSIDIFDNSVIKKLSNVFDTINENYANEFSIMVEWGDYNETTVCKNVLQKLSPILEVIDNIDQKDEIERCKINGVLHGDAHFGNYLIDASVPEDPLIVSIDPQEVDYSNIKEQLRSHIQNKCKKNDFDIEVSYIPFDPSYDIAKILLSSACIYGLAYKQAFNKLYNEDKFILKRIGKDTIRKVTNVGGISGSQIVNVDAPVTEDAWRYLKVASHVTIEEYIKLLSILILPESKNKYKSINAALIRLWLITVRHVFSISDKLFPRDIDRSLTMYLIGVRFVNIGSPTVLRALSNNLDDKALFDDLKKIFTDGLF